MEVLVLLLALAVVTLVGHGIWVALAALFRSMSEPSPTPQPPGQRADRDVPCPGCGTRMTLWERDCPHCGLDPSSPLAAQLRDLTIARRVVARLDSDGQLDPDTGSRLAQLFDRQRRRLLDAGRPRPQPAPSPPPPAPVEPVVLDALPVHVPTEPADAIPVLLQPAPPAPLSVPPPVPVEHRPVASVLAAFMEERNILWGELVGGLLIVGCSIALVLTLWNSLQQLPYFPVLLLGTLTASLFGAGLYTLHHWKLESTSRGLLVIALLLAPLELLLLADPSARGPAPVPGWLPPVVALSAVALLTLLVRVAGRDLIGADLLPGPLDRRWLLALAVVGTAGSQMLTPALLGEGAASIAVLLCLAAVPGLCYLSSTGAVLAGLARQDQRGQAPTAAQALALFAFLGLAVFSLLAALAFLMTRDQASLAHLAALALPVALAGVPGLAGGLFVHRRVNGDSAGPRTAGTAVALAGLALMLAGLGLAWPRPLPLLLVALLDGVVLTLAAFRGRAAYLHAGSLPCLALAVLLALNGWAAPAADPGAWLAGRLASVESGLALAFLVAGLAPLCLWLTARDETDHARVLGLGTIGLAVLALAAATAHGPQEPLEASAIHFLVAASAAVAGLRLGRHSFAQAGAWLLLPATLWALEGFWPGQRAAWAAVLAGEALVLVVAAHGFKKPSAPLLLALRAAGAAAGVLAVGLALLSGVFPSHPLHPITAAALSAAAFVLAGQLRQRLLVLLGSALALAGLVLLFEHQIPPGSLPRPIAVALLVHASLAALAGVGLARRPGTVADVFAEPLRLSGEVVSLAATGLLLAPGDHLAARAFYALWASLLWLTSAWRQREPGWFTLFQAGLSLAALMATRAAVDAPVAALDVRLLFLYGTVLAALGLGWEALRRVAAFRPLWPASLPALDRIVLGILVGGQLVLAVLCAWPGVVLEWLPRATLADFPTEVAHGAGMAGWLCLAVLAGTVLATLRRTGDGGEEQLRIACLAGLLLLAFAAAVLWAAPFSAERATASALRWALALVFVAGSALVWLRRSLPGAAVFHTLLGIASACVFLFSAVAAAQGFAAVPPGGPLPGCVFAHMGFTLSHLVPLLLLVAGLAGNALRERSAGYAFVACQLAWISVTAGYALGLPELDDTEGLFLCLLAVQTAGAGTLCWLAAARRVPAGPLLRLQAWLGLAVLAVLSVAPVADWIFDSHELLTGPFDVLGRTGGWLALGLAATADLLYARRHDRRHLPAVLGVSALVAGVLAGCLALAVGHLGRWPIYQVAVLTWAGLGAAAVVIGSLAPHQEKGRGWLAHFAGPISFWMSVLAAVLCLAAVLGRDDPGGPWVPGWAAVVAAGVLAAPALWFGRARFAYPSGLAFTLAGVLVWLAWGSLTLPGFLLTAALSLALAGAAWALPRLPQRGLPFGHGAAVVSLGLACTAVAVALGADRLGSPLALPGWLGWAAVAATALALAVQRGQSFTGRGLHVLSLAALGLLLHGLGLPADQLPWAAGLALGLHVAAGAAVARCFPEWAEREWSWLLPMQLSAAGVVVLLAGWACLVPAALLERLSGPLMVLLLAPAGWLLADGRRAVRREGAGVVQLDWLAPAALAAALSALAWAVPAGLSPAAWLQRHVWMLAALTAAGVAFLEVRGEGPRRNSARQVGLVLAGLAVLAALLALGAMLPLFDTLTRRTPLPASGIVAALLALVALVATALRQALSPRRELLGLSERGRMGYVYLAEGLLVLLFVHLRLNVPEIFSGYLARYWTLLVMGLAFLGVGASEWFDRRGLRVLAVPLQRTAVFLPVIPLLAFWARPPAALLEAAQQHAPGLTPFLRYLDRLPWNFDAHALIWFLLGGLYFVLALSRRSTAWALAGALAANFGLWALWAHAGVAFSSHPQAWLIPLGIIVLASEHLNRDDLPAEWALTLRYLGVCLIYVASTADLFIAGVGNSLWLPVLLAVVCVAGVLAGIWLRVRAFLFLGVGFLMLDVATMIWHAAVHRAHTWVWWASGVVLGLAIVALFALFEKRRNDVLRLVDELRRWD